MDGWVGYITLPRTFLTRALSLACLLRRYHVTNGFICGYFVSLVLAALLHGWAVLFSSWVCCDVNGVRGVCRWDWAGGVGG